MARGYRDADATKTCRSRGRCRSLVHIAGPHSPISLSLTFEVDLTFYLERGGAQTPDRLCRLGADWALEKLDDVQAVHANTDIPDEVSEAISAA